MPLMKRRLTPVLWHLTLPFDDSPTDTSFLEASSLLGVCGTAAGYLQGVNVFCGSFANLVQVAMI